MQDGEPESLVCSRDEQVRDGHAAVLGPLRQQALHLHGAAGDLVGERKVLKCLTLPPEVGVLVAASGAKQDLKIDDRARSDQAALHEAVHGGQHGWLAQPSPDALVGQVAGYRHAVRITSGSLRSGRAPAASSSR